MRLNNNSGFSLVEIMIVVVIIGLLAAMAIPAFQKVRESSRVNTMENNLRIIASAGAQYILEEGKDAVTYADLLTEGYLAEITDVGGEDYTTLTVETNATDPLTVTTKAGLSASYKYQH